MSRRRAGRRETARRRRPASTGELPEEESPKHTALLGAASLDPRTERRARMKTVETASGITGLPGRWLGSRYGAPDEGGVGAQLLLWSAWRRWHAAREATPRGWCGIHRISRVLEAAGTWGGGRGYTQTRGGAAPADALPHRYRSRSARSPHWGGFLDAARGRLAVALTSCCGLLIAQRQPTRAGFRHRAV